MCIIIDIIYEYGGYVLLLHDTPAILERIHKGVQCIEFIVFTIICSI